MFSTNDLHNAVMERGCSLFVGLEFAAVAAPGLARYWLCGDNTDFRSSGGRYERGTLVCT